MNSDKYGYRGLLEWAGADILAYKEFLCYGGNWLAFVKVNGILGWIRGDIGSCSACDGLSAFFRGSAHSHHSCHGYLWTTDLDKFDEHSEECKTCQHWLSVGISYGKTYLDSMESAADLVKKLVTEESWDHSTSGLVSFIVEESLGYERQQKKIFH